MSNNKQLQSYNFDNENTSNGFLSDNTFQDKKNCEEQYLKIQSLPQRKQCICFTQTSWLMLFKKIITINCRNHVKPINKICGQNAELLNVKSGSTYLPLCFKSFDV
jgi:hypothetical protein